MWIVFYAEDSHEMSCFIISEKLQNQFWNVIFCKFAQYFKGYMIRMITSKYLTFFHEGCETEISL